MGRRDIRWQPVPDTCGTHRKGSVTEQRAQMSTPTAAAAGNQRLRHGEVARRGTMAPSREDSDIRAPPTGTRYAVAYVASVSLAGVA